MLLHVTSCVSTHLECLASHSRLVHKSDIHRRGFVQFPVSRSQTPAIWHVSDGSHVIGVCTQSPSIQDAVLQTLALQSESVKHCTDAATHV